MNEFVTHVDFGGGLCAQAACFVALGLANSDRILGIAEITSQAMLNQQSGVAGSFRVRGLTLCQIEGFLKNQEPSGVTAQRQGIETGKPSSVERVATAMRTYLSNKMPVIPMVSLSRMLGIPDGDRACSCVLGDDDRLAVAQKPEVRGRWSTTKKQSSLLRVFVPLWFRSPWDSVRWPGRGLGTEHVPFVPYDQSLLSAIPNHFVR